NGSMEFDQKSLEPTYRFRYGIPGSSFALELAERLGIAKGILTQARSQLGDEKTKLERLIADLERQSQQYAAQLQDVSLQRDQLQSLVKVYEEKMTMLKKEMTTIKRKAVDEARELVKQAKSTIERSVKEIRESAANKEIVKSARENIRELDVTFRELSVGESENPSDVLTVGDRVKIRGSNETGEILEIHGSLATVLRGNARIKVNGHDLVKQSGAQEVNQAYDPGNGRIAEAKNEIDLRGFMGDEAIQQVQQFLDNAYAAGLHRVDIIHGKGTGALRKRITEFLKSYPKVKSFRLGEWNEGGTGVTVVEFLD
ncbi:MAG TPA: Smr/MutS family protein, partial [Bacteroidota bacterium]|nr:Smr/MutS family protein [Bacteroidota bacterium]